MIRLDFSGSALPQVLCLGAHCDDIEIGCGGTIAGLAREHPALRFHCWVFSGSGEREHETRNCLSRLVGGDRFELQVFDFRDGFFPAHWEAIKLRLRELSATVDPALVFTHTGDDSHQDHRIVSELTWNHFRRHPILEYEIVKYEGDLGRPNSYFPVSDELLRLKVEALEAAFATQRGKPWFTRSTFEAIARLRGIECHAPSGYAEAFFARKIVLDAAATTSGEHAR